MNKILLIKFNMKNFDKKFGTTEENSKNEKTEAKKIYLGLSILKTFLALDVIRSHCFNRDTTKNKFILILMQSRRIHVPSFVIMSFYFTHNTLTSPDINRKYQRFERLLFPYIGWPFIIFIMKYTLYSFGKKNYYITFKNLINQIILAQAKNMPLHFWFLFDLIILNFIFIFIIIVSRKHYLLHLELLMIFAYFFQYSGINYELYIFVNKIHSIARISELIPFSITGFILYEFNILNKLQTYKLNTSIISLLIYIFIGNYQVFSDIKGDSYHGIKLNFRSLSIIFIFSLLLLEKTKNKYLINLIKVFTNYTGGIFYLHQAIHNFFEDIVIVIKKGTLFSLFLIYFFSYIACFLGILIFGKTKAKYLFS